MFFGTVLHSVQLCARPQMTFCPLTREEITPELNLRAVLVAD